MKLAISNIAWNEMYDEEMYNFLKERNIVNLEIAPTRIIKDNPYENLILAKKIVGELLEKYKLSVKSMQSIWFGKNENIFENENSYFGLIDYTKKAIDFASAINCGNIVFGCPKNRNMTDYEKDYPKAVKFFKQIGEYAKSKNVVIAIEPNPVIYNTNFLNTTEEAINFVKEIDMESVKINYDLGTVIANNEDINSLKSNLHLINHIHISEPNLNGIEHKDLIKDLIFILKKEKYEKLVSIEMKQSDISIVKDTVDFLIKLIGDSYEI